MAPKHYEDALYITRERTASVPFLWIVREKNEYSGSLLFLWKNQLFQMSSRTENLSRESKTPKNVRKKTGQEVQMQFLNLDVLGSVEVLWL